MCLPTADWPRRSSPTAFLRLTVLSVLCSCMRGLFGVAEMPGPHAHVDSWSPLLHHLAWASAAPHLPRAARPALPPHIRLQHVVRSVDYSEAGAVLVEASAPDDRRCVVRARVVIVTLPIAVLASGSVRFTPALPAPATHALHALGKGLLNKVVLVFDRCVWPTAPFFLGLAEDRVQDCLFLCNMLRISGATALVAYLAGPAAEALEQQTDTDVLRWLMPRLRAALRTPVPDTVLRGGFVPPAAGDASDDGSGAADIDGDDVRVLLGARLLAMHVTRWRSDPFARMSYVYTPAGTDDAEALQAALARPSIGGGRVLFAGEALDRFAGTIHGAMLSGRRAAEHALRVGTVGRDTGSGGRRRSAGTRGSVGAAAAAAAAATAGGAARSATSR